MADPNHSESFYDILQVSRDATADDIRRAYKKQALMTHPDRLPAGHTQAEKQVADERFRKVSNAYEVLKDPESRKQYDTHGVWPPPTPGAQSYPGPSARNYPRSSRPRFEPFADPFANFFSEPFDLFESMFSEYRRPTYNPIRRTSSNWHRDPFEAMYRMHDMMADLQREMFSFPSHSLAFGNDSTPFGHRGQMQWASQSTMLSSMNGVTHRIDKRRDWDGNEHVRRTYPDGREVYTVNGIEQQRSSQGYLPPPGPPPTQYMPPSPAPQMNNGGYIAPPPSYHSSRGSLHSGYGERGHSHSRSSSCAMRGQGHRRDRHNSGPVIPADSGPVIPDADTERPRRWWQRGH